MSCSMSRQNTNLQEVAGEKEAESIYGSALHHHCGRSHQSWSQSISLLLMHYLKRSQVAFMKLFPGENIK